MDSPKITKSMGIAMDDLSLDKIYVLFPGNKKYQIEDKIIFFRASKLS